MPKYSDDWNKDAARKNNSCYNYALDKKSTGKKGKNLNPGDATGNTLHVPVSCKDLVKALKADLRSDPVKKTDKCPDGCWKIVCLLAPRAQPDADFHFYRQDDNGKWSHKRGSENATDKGTDGQPITDPEKDGKALKPASYSEVCGYFCVCPDKTKAIDVAMAQPQVGAGEYALITADWEISLPSTGESLALTPGNVAVLHDFADAPESIDADATITASLFSGRPNPRWYPSATLARQIGRRIAKLHFSPVDAATKPFGGFRLDNLAANGALAWVTAGRVFATMADGSEAIAGDSEGLSEVLKKEFAARFPCYPTPS